MESQNFTEDLKHLMRHSAAGMGQRLAALRCTLRSALGRIRALPRPAKMTTGACAAVVVVLAGVLALRGHARSLPPQSLSRLSTPAKADAARAARAASKRPVAGSAEELHGEYKAAAQIYAMAARKGDVRGLNKLLTMTRASKCEARSEAAEALGSVNGTTATAALKKLAGSSFTDESQSPGIFSCSSRRAAEKALDNRTRG